MTQSPTPDPRADVEAAAASTPFYVLRGFGPWWPALERLVRTPAAAGEGPRSQRASHAALGAALVADRYADPVHAAAADLLGRANAYAARLAGHAPAVASAAASPHDDAWGGARATSTEPTHGLRHALAHDLERLVRTLSRAEGQAPDGAPVLRDLAEPPHGAVGRIADALRAAIAAFDADEAGPSGDAPRATVEELLAEELEPLWRERGAGPLSLHGAFRWRAATFELVPLPNVSEAEPLESLVGIDRQLRQLTDNLEAFVDGRPALHTLLYGPRGSGKSTAVKALLPRYREAGLRLVELPPDELPALPHIIEAVRHAPQRVAVFVDDLSFDVGDDTYRPLKSLLEGSLAAPPDNVLAIATSNRRHLVAESHGDRPELGNDDVHRWDTQHERLALADRFGLAITFPSADQRRYLEIVRARAEAAGDAIEDVETLEREAIRFAEWGNGYSGRSAAQFLTQWRQRA